MLAGLLLAIEILCQDLSNVTPTKSTFGHGKNLKSSKRMARVISVTIS